MAGTNRILFSHYEENGPVNGRSQNLPGQFTTVRDITPESITAINGTSITLLSIIELLPSGLNQPRRTFKSPQTAAAIQTAST